MISVHFNSGVCCPRHEMWLSAAKWMSECNSSGNKGRKDYKRTGFSFEPFYGPELFQINGALENKVSTWNGWCAPFPKSWELTHVFQATKSGWKLSWLLSILTVWTEVGSRTLANYTILGIGFTGIICAGEFHILFLPFLEKEQAFQSTLRSFLSVLGFFQRCNLSSCIITGALKGKCPNLTLLDGVLIWYLEKCSFSLPNWELENDYF